MTPIILASYDIIAVSSSAGKDSLRAQRETEALAAEQGVLDRVVVIHADLGRAEWTGTADLARRQAGALPFYVCRRDEDIFDHARTRGRWMGQTQTLRWCTADHKTSQVHKVYTRLVREWRARTGLDRPCRILEVLGIRAAESTNRRKLAPFKHNTRASNKTMRHVDTWFPIFDVSNADMEPWKAKSDHPAYKVGMPRASCVFCVFAQKGALMLAGQANPELLDMAVALETEINHTFTKTLSLRDVREAIRSGEPVLQSEVEFDCGL